MQVSIQDEQGEELAAGETGEICVCGPAVFAGYYNNPEANAKSFRDGWFRTGDLGHVDEEGFLYITGRASDMYISGGSNVYPRETEEKILTHPAIAEVAILGVPDRTWGEVGVAVCVLRPEAVLNERELLAWLDGKVSRYKLPKRVFFWDALPKSGYGKITKKDVRAELEARGCLPLGQAGRGFGLRSDRRTCEALLRDALGRTQPDEDRRKSCLIRQIVLVTGGASGIGLAIVEAVLAEGWRAVVADLDASQPRPLSRCSGSIRPTVRFEQMNVADEEAVVASIAACESEFGPLTGVVNSAGIGRDVPALDTSVELFRRMLEVNLIGSFVVSREAAKHMQRARLRFDRQHRFRLRDQGQQGTCRLWRIEGRRAHHDQGHGG